MPSQRKVIETLGQAFWDAGLVNIIETEFNTKKSEFVKNSKGQLDFKILPKKKKQKPKKKK